MFIAITPGIIGIACLKMKQPQDGKELSISFDNSCGAFGNELRRIEICIFSSDDKLDNIPIKTIYPCSDQEIVTVMQDFLNGKQF